MQTTIHGICLRVVRYNDATSIATLWTRETGRMSVVLPAGASREARRRKALMMPMGCIEARADVRPGREIVRLSDVKPYLCGVPGAGDPVKGLVSMFLADFLGTVLRENQPDPLLTDFLFGAVEILHTARGAAVANFHLWMLYALGRFLGVAPDTGSYREGSVFDMREGTFMSTASMHREWLPPQQARVVWLLSRLNARNMHLLRISREERNAILDGILRYYTLHHTTVTNLPSVTVVRDVLA